MLNFVIAMQVIEIWGILRNGVCGSARSNELMDPQFTDYFPSETEGAQSESEDGDISQFTDFVPLHRECFEKYGRFLRVWGTKIPWFNHQSVENNSILFWVGRKFPKLTFYFTFGGHEEVYGYDCSLYISINGCKKRRCMRFTVICDYNNLYLCSLPQSFLQQNLNESNPTNQNHVEVTYKTHRRFGLNQTLLTLNATSWGVHVECICPPQESGRPNLPLLAAGHDDGDVDYWSELSFYGSDDLEAEEEEYQSPHDTSRSCMSWLVGPTTMLFKLFCFCCPKDF